MYLMYGDEADHTQGDKDFIVCGVNWPRFDRTPGIAQRAWGYPQARAYVGRLSAD
jgi:hypothetical protein